MSFKVTSPLTGGNPAVRTTQNPLVALFIAPACAAGSTVRVAFQIQSGVRPATFTNWEQCRPPAVMTFEIAGMHPSTAYSMHSQVNTAGNVVNGPAVSFTTGALASGITFPKVQVVTPASPTDPDHMILYGFFDLGQGIVYPNVATDLAGNIMWYAYPNDAQHVSAITRPLVNGYLSTQDGIAWSPGVQNFQFLREMDWAGNIVRETNTGILQQQVQALGDPDAAACDTIQSPAPVGAACIGIFHHDAIQTLPNGYTAVLVDVEKIFPPGTQGDSSGLPVDIVGDMIVVLDQNWNAIWYWDSFNPAGGGNGYPQLPVSRTAPLNEYCPPSGAGCLTVLLAGSGISPHVHDWLHSNSLYYWPHDGAAALSTAPGDLIWSSRNQDWLFKLDYQDGAGTGNILWRMGPSGDFSFVNQYNDPWPWFSHQHDAGIENNGTGVLDLMDNGNTRVSPPSGRGSSTGGVPGLGNNCGPHDCDSRGMAVTFDENTMQVRPVLSVDLGAFSDAMGSAQLLADGNYFFMPSNIVSGSDSIIYALEIEPTPGTDTGVEVMKAVGPVAYRAWQIPSLYSPPVT